MEPKIGEFHSYLEEGKGIKIDNRKSKVSINAFKELRQKVNGWHSQLEGLKQKRSQQMGKQGYN